MFNGLASKSSYSSSSTYRDGEGRRWFRAAAHGSGLSAIAEMLRDGIAGLERGEAGGERSGGGDFARTDSGGDDWYGAKFMAIFQLVERRRGLGVCLKERCESLLEVDAVEDAASCFRDRFIR